MICTKFWLNIFAFLVLNCTTVLAQWEAPSNYYSNATSTGASLKAQLTSAMSAGHIQRSYGDFRFSAAIHDQDPSNSSRIMLAYSGLSNSAQWDSAATWNREHVWPQARQPGSASNGTQGNLGDPHALRPCNTRVNSDRGNMPFGFKDTTGAFRDLGSYWFTGDACRGDIARSLFYSDTRWTSRGLSLVNGFPSGNQMGDLESLIEWHYLDPPDEFERRRNHTIFSQQFNPQYYTNNRNAYVDKPEFVWSIYVDQMNDSTITIAGGTNNANGSSSLQIDFGSAIVGANISASQSVILNKAGNDGTYYSTEALGDGMSDLEGSSAAFKTNGTDSALLNVSLAFDPETADSYSGAVMIDNLDITTEGGVGNGANDGDDFIGMTLEILDHANASFLNVGDFDTITIDLEEVPLGEPISPIEFSIFNLPSQAGSQLTASLDLTSVDTIPQNSFLTFSEPLFSGLAADDSVDLAVGGTPTQLGIGSTEFTFNASDEDLPGAQPQTLRLIVNYEVINSAVLLGDANINGVVNFLDVAPFIGILSNGDFLAQADCNQDGEVNFLDIASFIDILSAP
jgi:endonuclease I